MPSWTSASVRVSMEEVASSRISTGGSATAARAMASSWRWPWLRLAAVAGEHGVVAVGQAADEAVGVGQLGGGDALLVGGVQAAVADVLHHRAGEQVGVLEHHAQGAAEVRLS